MLATTRFSFVMIRQAIFAVLVIGMASAVFAYKPDSDAKEAFDRAVEFRKARDYRSARVELMNATAQDPNWGAAYIAQAEVALELFDAIGARAAIDKATSLGTSQAETTHLLGHAHWLLGDLEQARDLLSSDAVGPKHRADADRILGRVYMDMGDTIAAERAFDHALKSTPKDSKLWTEIARFRLLIANQGGAIDAADFALKLDPNNVRALELRGRLVRAQFGVRAALPWFERALQVSPNDVALLEEYGATLGEAGRYRDMLAQARKIIALDNNNARAFYMQAVIAARARNYDLARRLIPRIGGSFGDLPGPRVLSAIVEYQSGNWNLAADHLARLVEDQPQNTRLRTLWAGAMHQAGDHDDALDAIAPIADRPDADSYTTLLAARILEALGERKPAAILLDRAAFPSVAKATPLPERRSLAAAANEAQRNPRNAAVVIPYIRLLLTSGNSAAARIEANRLLQGNAGVVDAQIIVGDIEMTAGNSVAAIAAFERARKIAFSSPVMLRLVSAYRMAGNNAAASKTISEFLNSNPDSLIAQRLWAYDLADRAQWKDAIIWLKRARVRLGYNDAILNANIARAYAGVGQLNNAMREARLAYRIHPANIMTTYVYGQILLKSGKYPYAAFNILRKASKLGPDRKDVAKDLAAAQNALKTKKSKRPSAIQPG
jgi:cellulose synthase operon protein C